MRIFCVSPPLTYVLQLLQQFGAKEKGSDFSDPLRLFD